LVEIDHWGERLTGCPTCNRWQAATGEWCRLAPDDIIALRTVKATPKRVIQKQTEPRTKKELLMNKDDKPSRMKYVWPWLGFAALITAMWVVFAD
jgi:ferric-dicitrate binding protein FerR (iron transport regulator)